MIAIATNIYDFAKWRKYGYRIISKELLIDLSDLTQDEENLLKKTGLFEEDFEIFFCVIDKPRTNKGPIFVSIYDIKEIKPLSEKVIPVLKQKQNLGDFTLSAPIDDELYKKIHTAKLSKLSFDGIKYINDSFGLDSLEENPFFYRSLFESKKKLLLESSQKKDNWIDYLIAYERSNPYPVTDIGFIYDVGAIYRNFFNITDNDIKNKEMLKENDRSKYELITHILGLSKFLQSAGQESPFRSFRRYYETSDSLKGFNQKLNPKNLPEGINNILLFAIFLKFRQLIRDTNDLTNNTFFQEIEKFIKDSKKESTIALLMCGLLFGSLKLKELYYAKKIMPISTTFSDVLKNYVIEYIKKKPNQKKWEVTKIRTYLNDKKNLNIKNNSEIMNLTIEGYLFKTVKNKHMLTKKDSQLSLSGL